MSTTTFQELRLKYAAKCVDCGRHLPVGEEAAWQPTRRAIRCLACHSGDPFTTVPLGRGSPGASAQGYFGKCGDKGAEGERILAGALDSRAGVAYQTLHDRSIPGSKANIDHIAVAASGVFVIDAKYWSGRIEAATRDFHKRLLVGGRDRTNKVVETLERQANAVGTALGAEGAGDVPIMRIVCLIEGDWPVLQPSFRVQGVQITHPRALIRRLLKDGPLTFGARRTLARTLAERLPSA